MSESTGLWDFEGLSGQEVVRTGFFASREWLELRDKVLSQSEGRCECCGRSPELHGVVLHVNHVKPIIKYPELRLVLENLQVLCADCSIGKGWLDETDWRAAQR